MDQTRLNPAHVRVTPEGVRMMTLSRLSEILDAWESLTWPASRADAAAFRDRFGWTPDPLDGLLFTSDVVPEETSSSFSALRPDDIVGLDFIIANRPDFQPGNNEYKLLLPECQPYLTTIRQRLGKSLVWSKIEPDGIWRFATVDGSMYVLSAGRRSITLFLKSPRLANLYFDFKNREARGELEDWERE